MTLQAFLFGSEYRGPWSLGGAGQLGMLACHSVLKQGCLFCPGAGGTQQPDSAETTEDSVVEERHEAVKGQHVHDASLAAEGQQPEEVEDSDGPRDAADQEHEAAAEGAEPPETDVDQHDAVVQVSDGPAEAMDGERGKKAEEKGDAASSHVADSNEGHDEETSSTQPAQIAKRSVTFDVPDAPCPEPAAQPNDGAEEHRATTGQLRCRGDLIPDLFLSAVKNVSLIALLQAHPELAASQYAASCPDQAPACVVEQGELGAAEESKAELPNDLQPGSSEQAVHDNKAESIGDNAAHI